MSQLDRGTEALDVLASVAADATGAASHRVESTGVVVPTEKERVVGELLQTLGELTTQTGWDRTCLALVIGCRHPDPSAWLRADLSTLAHSQGVLALMVEAIHEVVLMDQTVRKTGLRHLAPELTTEGAQAIARRHSARAMLRLTKDIVQRASGSVVASRNALRDGRLAMLVAEDKPGQAWSDAKELLNPRADAIRRLERALGERSITALIVSD